MESNVDTHTLFFKIMTPKKLNELLHRASGQNSILQRDINNKLKSLNIGFAQVRLVQELDKQDGEEICSLYINFINQNGKFGHISFHFDTKRSIYKKNIVGRFHARNNRNNTRKYAFRINTNSNKSYITMSLSKFSANPVPILKQFIDVSLEVLNLYFNPNSNLYLGRHNPNVPLTDHLCLKRITKVFRINSGSLQKTRKASTTGRYVLSKQDSASSQTNRKSPWGRLSDKGGIESSGVYD
jgi:hypothetical protein